MDAFTSRLARSVRETLTDWISEKSRLLSEAPSTEFAHYRERVGEIKGYRKALELLDKTETDLGRPETTAPAAVERRGYET